MYSTVDVYTTNSFWDNEERKEPIKRINKPAEEREIDFMLVNSPVH